MITIEQTINIVTSACFETLENGIQQVIINLYSKEYEFLSSSSHNPSKDKSFEFGPADYNEHNTSVVTISGINPKTIRYDSRCKDQLIFLYVPIEMIATTAIKSEYVRWE